MITYSDPAVELAVVRAQGKPSAVRRKLRDLVPRDIDAGLTELPPNVALEPGFLTVRFATVEELASSLWRLAALLQDDLEGFAARYEPASEADAGEACEDEKEHADRSAARSRGSAENRPVESTRLLSLDNRKLLEPPICRYAKPKVFTPLSR